MFGFGNFKIFTHHSLKKGYKFLENYINIGHRIQPISEYIGFSFGIYNIFKNCNTM